MGIVAFISIFFVGLFISLFINKKTAIGLYFIGIIVSCIYFFGPLKYAYNLDKIALQINGSINSDFYLNIEEIKKAFEEINDEADAAKNLESIPGD
jgi:uncharacterized membrane protein YgaE (UPF0421/DUF939 family)